MSDYDRVYYSGSLQIVIYLIGYSSQGESIIFSIEADNGDNVKLFCAVIDSYEIANINKTIETIDKLGYKKIDLLCWTHPDEDHSLGIDTLLSKYVDNNSIILIPENIKK